MDFAARLVNELMPVTVLVAGEGAAAVASALEAAGAAAQVATLPLPDGESFDLVILLAPPGAAGDPALRDLVTALSGAGERLLFAPLPLEPAETGRVPGLADLTDWFELFAELGYQPMVEFDAGFVSAGAFLVDRAATAAESELAAFADRLQHGGEAAAVQRVAVQEAERVAGSERDTLRARLAEREAELAALSARVAALAAEVEAAQQTARDLQAQNTGWDALRAWIRHAVADPARDNPPALAGMLALLGRPMPPAPHRSFVSWLLGRPAPPLPPPWGALIADAVLIRTCPLFDAAWYVASNPDAAEGGAADPVLHYLLVGAPRGADPGPWFDTASYRARTPGLAEGGANPLVHAIGSGEAASIIGSMPR